MSKKCATAAAKVELEDFIQGQRLALNELEIWAQSMIPCVPKTEKNNAPAEVLQNYTLAFFDEFDQQPGTSLDCTKWTTRLPWGPDVIINGEFQRYKDVCAGDTIGPDPFDFDGNGNLAITAHFTPNGASDGQDYTSGVITTFDSFPFTEGYVETCMKMPCDTVGLWGAFWLLNRFYPPAPEATGANGKFSPEIDFEFVEGPGGGFGGGPYNTSCVLTAYHYDDGFCKIDANGFGCNPANFFQDPAASQQCDGTPLGTNFTPARGFDPTCNFGDFCQDFHTFGVWKTDEFVKYYVDGILVNSICDPNIVPQVPMYVIINQAVGGAFPGLANSDHYPATMLVDYVRIYTP